MRAPLAPWFLFVVLVLACSVQAQAARCAHCGMRVDPSSPASSGATENGAAIAFDSIKCLFRYRLDHPAISGAWVTDYYARSHLPIEGASFVIGSDVQGPMGPDLVALGSRADAERFSRDHHGAAIHSLSELTPAIVRSLFAL